MMLRLAFISGTIPNFIKHIIDEWNKKINYKSFNLYRNEKYEAILKRSSSYEFVCFLFA